MATCVDLAGAQYPKTYNGSPITPLEGQSLRPVFERGARKGHDALYWEHEGNRAVRQGRWKLVSRYPDRWELFDLEADRTELDDLAGRNPDRVGKMTAMYDAWANKCGVIPWNQLQASGTKNKKKG
jgi:arylsulfatase